MKDFFKYMLATVVGILLTSIIIFFIFFVILMGIISSAADDKPVIVKDNSILKVVFDNPIPERTSKNPFQNFSFTSFKSEQSLGLNDILKNIEKAKSDDKIKGIYLEITQVPAGAATIEEIRDALVDFKTTGKFIISYSDIYTQGAYYLASVSDKIYLNPEGNVEFKGLSAELMFYKNALEKIGVEPQIIRHGKFKSAIEPFILDKMSDANRLQTKTFMMSIWTNLLKGISESRNITIDELNNLADSMKISDAQAAVQYKLIDGLKYYDEILTELRQLSGIDEKTDPKFISMDKYAKVPKNNENGLKKEKIAVVYATGQIDMGQGKEDAIGSETLSKAIRSARLDSTIKAIVLRVNSPGGSALASEVIWREVVLAKQVKPVIVSMGDVAASGGYYISCPADVIVAQPNTITGSIGVFGVLWNGQKLLNDKIGITIDKVTTNAHSDIGSVYRPMMPAEKAIIQKEVEDIYDVFITHVSEGRNIVKAQVDSIGQGRVWSGSNAMDIKLIDEYGGINKAIEIAAQKANIENYRVVEFPKQKEFIDQLLEELKGDAEASVIKENLGESYKYYKSLSNVLKMTGVQARLPFDIDIY